MLLVVVIGLKEIIVISRVFVRCTVYCSSTTTKKVYDDEKNSSPKKPNSSLKLLATKNFIAPFRRLLFHAEGVPPFSDEFFCRQMYILPTKFIFVA